MSNNLNYLSAKMVASSIEESVSWGSNNIGYEGMSKKEIIEDLKNIAATRKTHNLKSSLLKLASAKDLIITQR